MSNLLDIARNIRNNPNCIYDNTVAYDCTFNVENDVKGWDIFHNIVLYNSLKGFLLGTVSDSDAYIGRYNPFKYIDAEHYYKVSIKLKVDGKNKQPTKAKLQWLTSNDTTWSEEKAVYFDLVTDNAWHEYTLNLGPKTYWIGKVNNLRIYPCIDGEIGDRFYIASIKIYADNYYRCTNTDCSYYYNYKHPCKGAGSTARIISKPIPEYTTIASGVNDILSLDINGYGYVDFNIPQNNHIHISRLVKDLTRKINSFGIGAYAYAYVGYDEYNRVYIDAGSKGSDGYVKLKHNALAETLGFYNSNGEDTAEYIKGTNPATGFDYAAGRQLTYDEIIQLVTGDADIVLNDNYVVEAGRSQFEKATTATAMAGTFMELAKISKINGTNSLIIDYTNPVNANGRIKHIYVNGEFAHDNALPKVFILRPTSSKALKVIAKFDVPTEDTSQINTTAPVTYRVDCDVLVEKGDFLAVYDMHLACPVSSRLSRPDAIYSIVRGYPFSDVVIPGKIYSYGVLGLNIYARGDAKGAKVSIDVEFEEPTNIGKISIVGDTVNDFVEYNVALCKDLRWQVELYNEYHIHLVGNCYHSYRREDHHKNIAYGIECLNDGITSADNGQLGTSWFHDSNGVGTSGPHAYFYVNGDTEWSHNKSDCLYNRVSDPMYEYSYPDTTVETVDYVTDPISIMLIFPLGIEIPIHKSIIYFKEEHNFKSLSLATYLGPDTTTGNSYRGDFELIPKYNSIVLDGVTYTPESSVNEQLFGDVYSVLFKNPTINVIPRYEGDVCVNQSDVITFDHINWNIIEHNFDPILAKGFMVHSDYHLSTKITEIEVYTYSYIGDSFLPAITIRASRYGDKWTRLFLDKDDLITDLVTSKVDSVYRFINIEFDGFLSLKLNNLEITPSDNILVGSCDNAIVPTDTGKGELGTATKVVVENSFDVPCDLVVDIPDDIDGKEVLYYSSLGSEKAIKYPVIGPPGELHKQSDFPLILANSQIAINSSCYLLENLANNVDIYLSYIEGSYIYLGKYNKDMSLNLKNDITTYKASIIFDEINCKYLKIQTDVSFISTDYFNFIRAKYKNEYIPIKSILLGGQQGASAVSLEVDYTTSENGSSDVYFLDALKDITTDNHIHLTYKKGEINTVNSYTIITDTEIRWLYNGEPHDSEFYGAYFEADTLIDNFIYDSAIYLDHIDDAKYNKNYKINYIFETDSDSGQLVISLYYEDSKVYFDLYLNGVKISTHYLYYHLNNYSNFTINKDGANLNVTYRGSTVEVIDLPIYTYKKFRIEFLVRKFIESEIRFRQRIRNVPKLDNTNAIAIGFEENVLIDQLEIFYGDHIGTNPTISLYKSQDNTYYTYVEDANYYLKVPTDYKLILDLGRGHILDIIRSYGVYADYYIANNVRGVGISNYLGSDVSKTSWSDNNPNLLLQFTDPITPIKDTSGNNYSVSTIGTIDVIDDAPTGFTKSVKIYDGSKIQVDFEPTSTEPLLFDTKDFTIHWFEKRENDGKLLDDATVYSYAGNHYDGFYVGVVNGDVVLRINTFANDFITLSLGSVKYGEWRHKAICRKNAVFYGFDNGKLVDTTTTSVGSNWDLPVFYPLRILTPPLYLGKSFQGYLAEFVIISDVALWTNDFTPPSSHYMVAEKKVSRWLSLNVPAGDDVVRHIDKLGVYPDITEPYANGLYNCYWTPKGDLLTNYLNSSFDLALGATVSGSSYITISGAYTLDELSPDKVIDGLVLNDGIGHCWGFSQNDTNPEITVDLDDIYQVERIEVITGLEDGSETNITDFDVYIYDGSIGASYVLLEQVTGNTETEVVFYYTNSITVKSVKLVINGYTSGYYIANADGFISETFEGSFIREIRIFKSANKANVFSDDHPIIAFDLKDYFRISNFSFGLGDTYHYKIWDKQYTKMFLSYDNFDHPEKISFREIDTDGLVYFDSSSIYDSTKVANPSSKYIFTSKIFLDKGNYKFVFKTLNNYQIGAIRLVLQSVEDVFYIPASITNTGWYTQEEYFVIPSSGDYSIYAESLAQEASDSWGVDSLKITKLDKYSRWVAFKYDFANNYSSINDNSLAGNYALDTVKIYSSDTQSITDNCSWWYSKIGTVSNEKYNTVSGSTNAVRVGYPTSSGVDVIEFIEGDLFGKDKNWSIMDFLELNLFISDIDKFDVSYGGVAFGNYNKSREVGYYGWDFKDYQLKSGWNRLRLPFYSASYVFPSKNAEEYFSDLLNFGYQVSFVDFKNIRATGSLGITYRGKGDSFYLLIDSPVIRRNTFDVDFGGYSGVHLAPNEDLIIPISNLNLHHGTVSFDFKPYYKLNGYDAFGQLASRTLFTITNNNNDIVSLGVRASRWFEVGVGNGWYGYKPLFPDTEIGTPVNTKWEPMRITLCWSNDGTAMDNGDTIRLYIDGELAVSSNTPWSIDDSGYGNYIKFGGGNTFLAYLSDSMGGGCFANLTICNYCETDHSFLKNPKNKKTGKDVLEISIDGVNYYNRDSSELPFILKQVPSNSKVTLYVRLNKTNSDKYALTDNILVDWVKPL